MKMIGHSSHMLSYYNLHCNCRNEVCKVYMKPQLSATGALIWIKDKLLVRLSEKRSAAVLLSNSSSQNCTII